MQAKEQAETVHQAQLTETFQAALQAGIAAGKLEAAGGFLPGIGDSLGRLSAACVMADDLGGSRLSTIGRIAKLICEHVKDFSRAAKRTSQGRHSGEQLVHLAQQLAAQQTLLRKRIDSISKQLNLAKEAVQQSYDQVAAAAGVSTATEATVEAGETGFEPAATEETPLANIEPETPGAAALQEHLITSVTQTGTESAPAEQAIAPEEVQDIVPENFTAPAQL